jgi:hypothetical protein
MPDTTRTNDEDVQQLTSDLVKIAMSGLLPDVLAERRDRLSSAYSLGRVVAAGPGATVQSVALIGLLLESIRLIPSEGITEMAVALFGVQERHRHFPYDQRRGNAIRIWDPEDAKEDESWTRRILPRVTGQIAIAMLKLDAEPSLSDPPRGAKLPFDEHWRDLLTVAYRAETWLTGRGQQTLRTDWTKTEFARRDGVRSVRQYCPGPAPHHLEPLTDSIRKIEHLGTARNGTGIWLVTFAEPLEIGQSVTWATATIYDGPYLDLIDDTGHLYVDMNEYIPVGVKPTATFIAHFDEQFPPNEVVRFLTPTRWFPGLFQKEELKKDSSGAFRATFDTLGHSLTFGISWVAKPAPS